MRFALLLVAAGTVLGQPADALKAIEEGRYRDAEAVLQGRQEPESLLALGVARVLGERFEEAVEPLDRSFRLVMNRPGAGAEADLWLYTCEVMSGIVTERHAYHIRPRGQPLRLEGQPKTHGQNYPADYATFVYRDLAFAYMTARTGGESTASPRIRSMIREAGQRFAGIRWARPEYANLRRTEARAAADTGQYAASLDRLLSAARPDDTAWLQQFSDTLMNMGRYATARRWYTVILHRTPTSLGAWMRRAYSAASMGDARRARSDWETAKRINPSEAAKSAAVIDKAIAAASTPPAVEAALRALEDAASKGAPLPELVQRGRDVHRAAWARRLVYEETYLDRVLAFENAVRAQPGAADVRVNYARYLHAEADARRRSMRVEPSPDVLAMRMGMNVAAERAHALRLLDEALRIAPTNVRALCTKAIVLDRLGRFDEGGPLIARAMQLAPSNPEVLKLRSEYLVAANWEAQLQASSLRTPAVLNTQQYDSGNYRVTETTYRNPDAGQLAQASQLEAAARRYRQGALDAIQAALRASEGTAEGFILRAEYEWANGRGAGSLAALRAGEAKFPNSIELRDAFVRYAQRVRDEDLEEDQESARWNLMESTAGPKLRKAWRAILRTDWAAADRALREAQQMDPADARVFAYRGVSLKAQGQAAAAARAWMLALALEEARLSFDESAASAGATRSAGTVGLALRLRLLIAGKETTGPAADLLRGAWEWTRRIEKEPKGYQMWTAMLPDPSVEIRMGELKAGGVRWPDNAITLITMTRLGYAGVLRAQGRTDEARRLTEEAALAGERRAITTPTRAGEARDFNENRAVGAAAQVYVDLMKEAIARNDINKVLEYHNQAINAKPTREIQAELETLFEQFRQRVSGQDQQPPPRRRR